MPFTPRPPRRPSPSRASGPPFSRRAVLSWATGEGTPPVLRAMTAQGRPNCQAALQPWKRCLRILLLLGHVDDLNAVVISAMLAHAVGQLLFVTLRALDDAGQAELPICAALAATGLGYFSLGKSQGYTSSFRAPSLTGLSKSFAWGGEPAFRGMTRQMRLPLPAPDPGHHRQGIHPLQRCGGASLRKRLSTT